VSGKRVTNCPAPCLEGCKRNVRAGGVAQGYSPLRRQSGRADNTMNFRVSPVQGLDPGYVISGCVPLGTLSSSKVTILFVK
jgi:hypothetical protein